jgi:hypothetical protein
MEQHIYIPAEIFTYELRIGSEDLRWSGHVERGIDYVLCHHIVQENE